MQHVLRLNSLVYGGKCITLDHIMYQWKWHGKDASLGIRAGDGGEVLLLFFLFSFYEFDKVGIVESQFRTQVGIGQIWANIWYFIYQSSNHLVFLFFCFKFNSSIRPTSDDPQH